MPQLTLPCMGREPRRDAEAACWQLAVKHPTGRGCDIDVDTQGPEKLEDADDVSRRGNPSRVSVPSTVRIDDLRIRTIVLADSLEEKRDIEPSFKVANLVERLIRGHQPGNAQTGDVVREQPVDSEVRE